MADSPSCDDAQHLLLPQEAESQLASLVYDMSQQVQTAMETLLKMTNEIDQSSNGIVEDIEKCRDFTVERKKSLEEQKERFQRAVFAIIDMLNGRN